MSSEATGRFFYSSDWPNGNPPPCDLPLANARWWLLKILESLMTGQAGDADDVVRYVDKLIEAHVAAALYKRGPHSITL